MSVYILRYLYGEGRGTYVKSCVLLESVEPLVLSEALGDNSLLHLPHAQLHTECLIIVGIISTARTGVGKSFDEVVNPAASVENTTAGANLSVQALFAGLDKSECFIDIIAGDLIAEAETGESLSETDHAEEGTRGGVSEGIALLLGTLLLVTKTDVGLDHVLGHGLRNGGTVCPRLGNV